MLSLFIFLFSFSTMPMPATSAHAPPKMFLSSKLKSLIEYKDQQWVHSYIATMEFTTPTKREPGLILNLIVDTGCDITLLSETDIHLDRTEYLPCNTNADCQFLGADVFCSNIKKRCRFFRYFLGPQQNTMGYFSRASATLYYAYDDHPYPLIFGAFKGSTGFESSGDPAQVLPEGYGILGFSNATLALPSVAESNVFALCFPIKSRMEYVVNDDGAIIFGLEASEISRRTVLKIPASSNRFGVFILKLKKIVIGSHHILLPREMYVDTGSTRTIFDEDLFSNIMYTYERIVPFTQIPQNPRGKKFFCYQTSDFEDIREAFPSFKFYFENYLNEGTILEMQLYHMFELSPNGAYCSTIRYVEDNEECILGLSSLMGFITVFERFDNMVGFQSTRDCSIYAEGL